eukprot:s2342_g3.t1
MIWAHVERGMISTNYTADMIQPEESPPKPKEVTPTLVAVNPRRSRAEPISRRTPRRSPRPRTVQHVITPPRLGHSIVIDKTGMLDTEIATPTRPLVAAGTFLPGLFDGCTCGVQITAGAETKRHKMAAGLSHRQVSTDTDVDVLANKQSTGLPQFRFRRLSSASTTDSVDVSSPISSYGEDVDADLQPSEFQTLPKKAVARRQIVAPLF